VPEPPPRPRRLIAEAGADGVTRFVADDVLDGAVPPYGGVELYRAWSAGTAARLPVPAGDAVRVTIVRFRAGAAGAGRPFARQHWHDTVDVQIVIEGEIAVRLDDGSEATLRAGDVVVQCGGSHAWEVRGERDAVVAIVAHDARRDGPAPPESARFERVFAPQDAA